MCSAFAKPHLAPIACNMTSQAFNEAIYSVDVLHATSTTRALVREMRSGSARSPLLRTVLYDQVILTLLNKIFGEGVDPNAQGRHLCWFDGAAGARFEDFEEMQLEGANLDQFSNAERRLCASAANLSELFNVSHVACTTPELRRALGLPAAIPVAPGAVIPDSFFADPGMERRTFLLQHDVLPQSTRIILDATGGAAPVLRSPLAQELFSRTEPLLLVLQRHADATSGPQGIPMLGSLAARINPPKPRPGTTPGATGAFGAGGAGGTGAGAGGAGGATGGAGATGAAAAAAAAADDSSWRSDGGIFVSLPDLLVCYFVHFAVSATRRRIPKERFTAIRDTASANGGNGGGAASLFDFVLASPMARGGSGGGGIASPSASAGGAGAGAGAGAGFGTNSMASAVSEDWEEASALWRRVSPAGVPHGPSDAFAYRTLRSLTRDTPYMAVLFAWFDAALPMTEPPAHVLSETLLAAVSAYWLLHNPPSLLPLPGESRPPQPNPLGILIGLPGEQPGIGGGAATATSVGAGAAGGIGGLGQLGVTSLGPVAGGLSGATIRARFGPAGAMLGLDDPTDGLGRRAAATAAGTRVAGAAGGAPVPGAGAGRDTFPIVAEPRYLPPTLQQLQCIALLITLQQCDDSFHAVVSGARPSGQGGRAIADLARDAVRTLHAQPAKRASLGADPARLAYLCMLTGLAPPSGIPAAAALGVSGVAGGGAGGGGLGGSGVFGSGGGGGGVGALVEVQHGAASGMGMGMGYGSAGGGMGAGAGGGAAADPTNLRRFTGGVTPSSLAAVAASQRVSLMPAVWERLQHPLFTFLRIHLARISPATDPSGWAHIVDAWIMVLTPWRARNRYKAAAGSGIALFVPAPTARCFDYAGQAQGALGRLARRRTAAALGGAAAAAADPAAAAGGAVVAGAGGSFAAEEVADELRAPATPAAAVAAAGGAGGVGVTADRKFAAAVAVGHDFERGHVMYRDWEEWRPWVAGHYAFYTYLLRVVVAAAAAAPLAAPHPSPVLEALERVLDVFEPCVVAELHRVREVAEATFEPRAQAREGAVRRAAAAAAAAAAGPRVARGAGARVVGVPAAAGAAAAAAAATAVPLTPAAAHAEAVDALRESSNPAADATRLRLLAHLAALRLPPTVDPREIFLGTADWDVQDGLRRLCAALHAASAAVPPPPTTEVLTRFVRPPQGTPGALGAGYGSAGGGGAGVGAGADPMLGRLDSTKEDGAGGAGAGAGAAAAAPAAPAGGVGAGGFDLGAHIDSQPISPAVTAPLVQARASGAGGASQAFALDAVTGGAGGGSSGGGTVWLPSADRLQLLADRIAIAFGPVPPSPLERASQRQAAAAPVPGAGRASPPPADAVWPGSLLSSEDAIRRAVAVCAHPAYAGVALPMRVPRQLMGAAPAAAGALIRRPRGLLTALTACCSSSERRRYCAGVFLSCIRRCTGLRLAPAPPLRAPYAPLRDVDILQEALLTDAAAANAAAAGARGGAGAAAAAAGAGADGAAAALARARTEEDRLQVLAQGLLAPHSLPIEAGLLTARGRADLLSGSALMFSRDVRVALPEQLRPVGSAEVAWLVEATRRINARLLWGLARLTGLQFTATQQQVDEALRALQAGNVHPPAAAGAAPPPAQAGLLQRRGVAELILKSQLQPRNYLRPLADRRIAIVALLCFAALHLRWFGVSPALFAAMSVYMLTFFLLSW